MEISPNHASLATTVAGAPHVSPSDLPDGEGMGLVADAAPDEEAGRKVRVLVVDDQPMVRRGLGMRLEIEPDMEVVGEAKDGAGAVDGVAAQAPDVVIMDVRMEGMDGIEATAALRLGYPEVAVVVLTLQDDPATRGRAAAAGAAAFVGKHRPEGDLIEEIRRVARPFRDRR
jgi:DNA-binding NarL/FixJ family response regulator